MFLLFLDEILFPWVNFPQNFKYSVINDLIGIFIDLITIYIDLISINQRFFIKSHFIFLVNIG